MDLQALNAGCTSLRRLNLDNNCISRLKLSTLSSLCKGLGHAPQLQVVRYALHFNCLCQWCVCVCLLIMMPRPRACASTTGHQVPSVPTVCMCVCACIDTYISYVLAHSIYMCILHLCVYIHKVFKRGRIVPGYFKYSLSCPFQVCTTTMFYFKVHPWWTAYILTYINIYLDIYTHKPDTTKSVLSVA